MIGNQGGERGRTGGVDLWQLLGFRFMLGLWRRVGAVSGLAGKRLDYARTGEAVGKATFGD